MYLSEDIVIHPIKEESGKFKITCKSHATREPVEAVDYGLAKTLLKLADELEKLA
jgi:hypothetical protein